MYRDFEPGNLLLNKLLKMFNLQYKIAFLICTLFGLQTPTIHAQFLETFQGEPSKEWITFTGDGDAVSALERMDSWLQFKVDATDDTQNVWWAIAQTTLTDELDLEPFADEDSEYGLRMEARIRVSHAPRRFNMQLRTQRYEGDYAGLMEFDIPESGEWFTVSMTLEHLDIRPGDQITPHLAMMDWGPFVYTMDIDYVKVDVVTIPDAGEDLGEQVVYPPPVPQPQEFEFSLIAAESGMIDRHYPDLNMSGWVAGDVPALTLDNTKFVILRWDLSEIEGRQTDGYGMLELTPFSFYQTTATDRIEFDQIRMVEILGGDPYWKRESVTYESFLQGELLESVLNTQMIHDITIPSQKDEVLTIHLPKPVVQRLIDGKAKGIAFYPLGALQATFYRDGEGDRYAPRLYYNLEY